MGKPRILVVDDEKAILFTISQILKKYDVFNFGDAQTAIDAISSGGPFDVLIVDFRLQPLSGLDVLNEAKRCLTSYRAILLTAFASKELLENSFNNKLIFKAVNKPFDPESLVHDVDEALQDLEEERGKNQYISNMKKKIDDFVLTAVTQSSNHVMVFKSQVMQNTVQLAQKYALSNAHVQIQGENGVGKEIIANIIHMNSKRKNMPIVKINCSAIPDTLLESELFGHIKGAFSGSLADKKGKFEIADGGTILLDEIGDLSLQNQPKLLRVLESKELTPLGATAAVKIDVRILSSTNKDLRKMVQEGTFREDLYHRLAVLNISVPPLRERREDIPFLSAYFLKLISVDEGGPDKELSSNALSWIMKKNFSGNVRELKNLIYRMYLCSEGQIIMGEDAEAADSMNDIIDYTVLEARVSFNHYKEIMERKFLEKQLANNGYNLSKTAKSIQLQIGNLSRKLKELGIDIKQIKEEKKAS